MKRNYKIVLVDDEPWALVYLKKVFSRADLGFEVVAAESNAFSALKAIDKYRSDIAITDVRIPQTTGLEFLKSIREKHLSCEVIIVSAYAEFEYAQEALRYGAFDYCLKPVSFEDAQQLLERLRSHLERKEYGTSLFPAYDSTDVPDNDFAFENILVYVKNNYMKRLYLKDLAKDFSISPNYCSSLFTQKIGMTFSQYVTKLRMEQAIQLLCNKHMPISKIASIIGYDDIIYFTKVFKKYYHLTPSKYRESIFCNPEVKQ